jgi:hypothetical protein
VPITTPTPTPIPSVQAVAVGDIIPFGGYNWRVLDVQGNYALILTENVIEQRTYHFIWESVTWETSSIRQYLNGEFLNNFSQAERARIRETTVINNDNPWTFFYSTGHNIRAHGGNNTSDRIFLLSINEVLQYFGDSGMMTRGMDESIRINDWTQPPPPGIYPWGIQDQYGEKRIAYTAGGSVLWWWLRSPGMHSANAAVVGIDGDLTLNGGSVVLSDSGVRPALWLNIDSIFDSSPAPTPIPTQQPTVPAYITIQGQRYSTALTSLHLNDSNLTNNDIIPLRYMKNLTELTIAWTQITDISPLSGLVNLTRLFLIQNQISDITPLTGLVNLSELHLRNNQITNIIPLAELKNLSLLYSMENQISNITPLAGLENLTVLYLTRNQIIDISPLSGLVNLTILDLAFNQIVDITPLSGLVNLSLLNLTRNRISDISPLSNLMNQENIYTDGNPITNR